MAPQYYVLPITNITDQLIRDEDLRIHPYNDSRGIETIGVGRNLKDKGISVAEAKYLLNNDITDVLADLKKHLPWTTSLAGIEPVRYAVLANMGFNIGVEGLSKFNSFLGLVAQHKWAEAAADGRTTAWAKELPERSERLMAQLETGKWM